MPQLKRHSIIADDLHVSLFDASTGRTIWRLAWSEVAEIAAWKEDVWSYDVICVGFLVGSRADYYRCTEEDQGWRELWEVMEHRLRVRHAQWWERIAFPPFQQNWTVLWNASRATTAPTQ